MYLTDIVVYIVPRSLKLKIKQIIYNNYKEIDKIYICLSLLRIILTLIPQWGYIHPDEFFQSIEVVAEDIFDVESNRPWEYNASFPVRSIFTSTIVIGTPYKFLRMLDYFCQYYLAFSIKSSYTLLVFPRLFLCLLSFVIDFCLYKICMVNYLRNYKQKLLVLASSYVVIVYGTHTFSNTIEMILLSMLLYLVADSQNFSYVIIKENEFLTKEYHRAESAADRARLYKMKASLPSHSTNNCIFISFVTVLGFFNRPTFVAFAFPSIFFWIHRGINSKIVPFREFHYRMLLFLLCSFMFTFFFIIIDSFYFGYLSIAEILHFDISINNFVATPFNFLKYNMDVSKLSEHGLHPRFMHVLINIPLLYNILGVVAIGNILMMGFRLISGHFTRLPRIHSIEGLMVATCVFPVLALSYFRHQEPRFLIPITLPLVYLYSNQIFAKRTLLRAWCLINGICILFYGFIHQAGLFPLTSYMSQQIQNGQSIHLVTSHVYNIPVSLFLQHNSRRVYGSGSSKYMLPKLLILHELGSEQPSVIVRRFEVIKQVKSLQSNRNQRNHVTYFAFPLSKDKELRDYIKKSKTKLELSVVKKFYPHISTEALPNIFHKTFDTDISIVESFLNVFKSCGLGLYKVYYNETII